MKYLCPRDFRRGEMEEKMKVREMSPDERPREKAKREAGTGNEKAMCEARGDKTHKIL